MIFCPKCGRQRTGNVRFCGGCGNDFGEQAADSGTPLAAELTAQLPWDASANATRLETPDAAPAPTGPDPFAPWVAAPSPADEGGPPSDLPADRWETADTMYAQPTRAPRQPTSQPAPAFPSPSGPGGPGRRSGGGKRAAFIIVVVLVALATGGGAYALVSRSHQATAQPPSHPTVTAHASTAPAVQPSNSPAASAARRQALARRRPPRRARPRRERCG